MKNKFFSTKTLFLCILFFAFVVRLYHFNGPIGDWHSWRQADTSAVSRNFIKFGFDVLHPRYDDLSNVASGFDNPLGLRFVEFPLYNVAQAGLFKLVGVLTIEEWGRMVTILSSLLSITFLYLLIKKYVSEYAGLLTAFFYAFLPYNIYYGRVILPDPSMVAAILGGIYFFDRWLEETSSEKKKKSFTSGLFILALLATSISFLLKPYALFFTLPMVYLAWKRFHWRLILQWQLWVFLLLSVTPLILWRQYIMQFPEGIPVNQWLLNGNGIRFRPSFFRWIGYERITKLISGYAGVILLLLGTYQVSRSKNTGLFLSFLLSSIIYVCVFATGNVQHDYYQILIMPTVAIFYGLGAYYLLKKTAKKLPYLGLSILVLLTGLTFFFSGKQVKDYFNINNPTMVAVGKMVDATIPKNAKVITLYNGDTSFLYQTNRQGWSSFQNPLPEMIHKGAQYLIQLDPTPGDIILYSTEYEITASNSAYVIVKLQ